MGDAETGAKPENGAGGLGQRGTLDTPVVRRRCWGWAGQAQGAPAEEYGRRLGDRRALVARLSGVDARMGVVRLVLAGAAAGAGLVVVPGAGRRGGRLHGGCCSCPLRRLCRRLLLHAQVVRCRGLARRAVAVYEAGLARVEDRWASVGSAGLDQTHADQKRSERTGSHDAFALQTEPRGAYRG